MLLPIVVDTTSLNTLQAQVVSRIRELILTNRLKRGTQLPWQGTAPTALAERLAEPVYEFDQSAPCSQAAKGIDWTDARNSVWSHR